MDSKKWFFKKNYTAFKFWVMRVPRETKPINWKQFAALDVNALREQLSEGKINLPIKEIASGIADCLPEDEFVS